MAGSTTKKAIVRRYEKEPLAGYVNPGSYLQPEGVELLSPDGKMSFVPYAEIKLIAFVREFGGESELERRTFVTRPKMEGLWVRLGFRDGDVMEGVMPNNLLQLEPYGFGVIPPDSVGNLQRVFVPRAALRSVEVLGVVGSPLRRRKPREAPEGQIGLFDE